MEFKIITTDPKERTYAYQLKAILQFDSAELATKAYRSLIGSTMAGQLMPCKTYHVDNCLVLCAYEETFGQLIEFLKNLDPADADNTERTHFWDSFFHNDNWADIIDAAYDYFHVCFPEQTDWEDDNYLFQFTYRGTTFFAEMHDSSVDGSKVNFYADEDREEFLFAIGLTDDPRKIIDDFIDKQVKPAGESKVTPESAMFAAMKDIDFAKALPKDTETKLKGIANLFFQSWLKDASVFGVEASDDIAAVNWVEAWFLYKGKKYHLDFCMEEGNTLCLYTTNQYQENVDCAYVTVDTLQEKIDSVDDTGHFPGHIPETPRKSLEERLDKVEHLIASLQDEVAEIKKKI